MGSQASMKWRYINFFACAWLREWPCHYIYYPWRSAQNQSSPGRWAVCRVQDLTPRYYQEVCFSGLQKSWPDGVDYSFKRSGRKVVGIDWDIRDLKFQNMGPKPGWRRKSHPWCRRSPYQWRGQNTSETCWIRLYLAQDTEKRWQLKQKPYGLSEEEVNRICSTLLSRSIYSSSATKAVTPKARCLMRVVFWEPLF